MSSSSEQGSLSLRIRQAIHQATNGDVCDLDVVVSVVLKGRCRSLSAWQEAREIAIDFIDHDYLTNAITLEPR